MSIKINRCHICNKKLKLSLEFFCKCSRFFCNIHRYTDIHNCDFDWKAYGKEKIKNENPKIDSKKIIKI